MASVPLSAEARMPSNKTGSFASLMRSTRSSISSGFACPNFGADNGLMALPSTWPSVTSCGIDRKLAPFLRF